jgi:hypothetical protein
MADQFLTKLARLIKDVNFQVHGILYIPTFTVMKQSDGDGSYSMMLGRPWLKNAKVLHDWGNNQITIESNGTSQIIQVTKCLEAFMGYDFVNGVINEEEEVLLVVEPNLFTIGIISY